MNELVRLGMTAGQVFLDGVHFVSVEDYEKTEPDPAKRDCRRRFEKIMEERFAIMKAREALVEREFQNNLEEAEFAYLVSVNFHGRTEEESNRIREAMVEFAEMGREIASS